MFITPDGVVYADKIYRLFPDSPCKGPSRRATPSILRTTLPLIPPSPPCGNVTSLGNIIVLWRHHNHGQGQCLGGFNGACGPDPGAVGLTINCNRDVAETFATDQRTEPGDIVVFVPEDRAHPAVRLSSGSYAPALVGVVSTSPGLVFDEGKTFLAGDNTNLITDKKTVVAMVGRVPVKYSLENGPIAVGDPLTSSSTPGAAMKATQAGQIIGYAMQSSECGWQRSRRQAARLAPTGHLRPPRPARRPQQSRHAAG